MSDYQIETRRRSRSKTPFLRSNCDHENCEYAGEEGHSHHHHHQKKKAPNVQTIVEETVEVLKSSYISPAKQMLKTKTSDYSSEDTSPESKTKKTTTNIIEESSKNSKQMSSSSTNRTTTTTSSTAVVTKSKRLAGGSITAGGAATSTPKIIQNYLQESFASQFTGGGGPEAATQRFKEITQNVLNAEFERSQQSSKNAAGAAGSNNSSLNKSYTQFLNNSNGDLSDHIAYLEYKRAGEYWNTTPKTDYTYSEHSSFRRELAPGIVAMPNMSRTGLKNHNDRINYMIQRDPAQEEYIRRRYEASRYAQNRRATEKLTYDSGDEIDYELDSYRKRQYNKYLQEQQESWYMRIITTIVTTITNAWTRISGGGDDFGTGSGLAAGYNTNLYRTNYGQEKRGFFGTIQNGISSSISRAFRYIYLLISYVLCLDTWLLQSRSADGKGKKRGLLLLLILVPLLLLGVTYYQLHPNETFPPSHFSEMTFTLPQLPDFSQINMSEYFNQDQYVAIKENTLNRFEDFRAWSDDYIMYLRAVSNNILDEGRKYFQREEHYERA